MRSPVFPLIIALLLPAAGATVGHAEPVAREAVDAVLSCALQERAAFRACAVYENDAEAEMILVRAWRLDLAETGQVLREAGYPEGDVHALSDRLDLDNATPKFATREAGGTFCASIGDWKRRWALLMALLPQFEIKKVLKQ